MAKPVKEDYREFGVLIAASYEAGVIVPIEGFDPSNWEQAVREAVHEAIRNRPLASNIRVVVKITERAKP